MKAKTFFCILAAVCCVILSGCAFGGMTPEEYYSRYGYGENPSPGAPSGEDWRTVMQQLPYKFGFHIASPDKNIVIHKSGQDAQTSYLVLNWVMEQSYPALEVWMNSILQEKIQYGENIKAYLRKRGYGCVKEWYETVPEIAPNARFYKMAFKLDPLQEISEDWESVMQQLPHKFGFHIPNTDENYVIHKSGHDGQMSHNVLTFVMEQRYPVLEVWMNSIHQERLGYGENVKAYMRKHGYAVTKEWYEAVKVKGVPGARMYKMRFTLQAAR